MKGWRRGISTHYKECEQHSPKKEHKPLASSAEKDGGKDVSMALLSILKVKLKSTLEGLVLEILNSGFL